MPRSLLLRDLVSTGMLGVGRVSATVSQPLAAAKNVVSGQVPLLAVCLMTASCAHDALTLGVRDRNQLGVPELRAMQLYTSDDIELRREENRRSTEIRDAKLSHQEVRVHKVFIPKGTRGVALQVEECHILVSFSPKEREAAALWFSVKRRDTDWVRADATYELSHLVAVKPAPPVAGKPVKPNRPACADPEVDQSWVTNLGETSAYVEEYSPSGFQVLYGGKYYNVIRGEMWHVHLLYDEIDPSSDIVTDSPDGWDIEKAPAAKASGKVGR